MENNQAYTIRNAKPEEFKKIGALIVQVYSQLEGFPNASEQPAYYNKLSNVGDLTNNGETELLVAVSSDNTICAAVVYFSDMQYYGSGGIATQEKNVSGFRLLAVDPTSRGHGIGKLLTNKCIEKARKFKHQQVIIHSTKSMKIAWSMYENLGFLRSKDLDFVQGDLHVYGFRLKL
ncbi:MAG: GNAT family N-acetyltransferase [Flavobacteriaceae bacterium]|nr:GNAT family N-acetyltransferase [Flavobacteriaceae bacterium]